MKAYYRHKYISVFSGKEFYALTVNTIKTEAAEICNFGGFPAFRFLLGGSTIVQLPLARKRNSPRFLEVCPACRGNRHF